MSNEPLDEKELIEHGVLLEGDPDGSDDNTNDKLSGEGNAPEDNLKEEPKDLDNSSETDGEGDEPDENTFEIVDVDGKKLLRFVDEDGEIQEREEQEVRGGTYFKDKYDHWVNEEKKPLEEKAQILDELGKMVEDDPVGYLTGATIQLLQAQHPNFDFGELLSSLAYQAQVMGVPVQLVNSMTGDPIDAHPPAQRQQVQQPASAVAGQTGTAEVADLQLRAERAEAMLSREIADKMTISMTKKADELYRNSRDWLKQQDEENPYRAAAKLVIAEQLAFGKKSPSNRKQSERGYPGPSLPKNANEDFDDETQQLIKDGILVVK